MAEREGFEPPIPLRVCMISSHVHSTRLCHLSCKWVDMVSNVARRVNAEEPEPRRKHLPEERAEPQTRRADGRLALEYWGTLVKTRVELRRLEEIVCEYARLVGLRRADDCARKLEELKRKPLLSGSLDKEFTIHGQGCGTAVSPSRQRARRGH